MSSDYSATKKRLLPWLWVPTLYLFEGIPNSLVENVGPILLQDLNVAKETIPTLVAVAALPWALKPFWSPLLDLYRTKRFWIWIFQACTAAMLMATAFLVFAGPLPATLAVLLAGLALFSATHDIVADGFYLHGLDAREQSFFVGIRSTCYRLAQLGTRSLLVGIAGFLVSRGNFSQHAAWAWTLGAAAIALFVFAGYHKKILPRPPSDVPVSVPRNQVLREFAATWREFFRQRGIFALLAFFLFFRLSEVQIVRMASIFLKDARSAGGLALDNETMALVYGTLGTGALITGGILGGIFVSRFGLRRLIWPMVLIMHLPNFAFVALAHWQPAGIAWIAGSVALEQFGYGIGYTAFSVVMLRIAEGPRRTAFFSFATGLAYLGSLIPGFWVGSLQKAFGYENFFWWVMLCTIPGFFVTRLTMREVSVK